MKSPHWRRVLFSLLVALVFIVPLVRAVDFGRLRDIIYRADGCYLSIAFCSLALANVIRAYRFRALDHSHARFAQWWIMNSVYNASTATLPGGAGEAVTAFLIKNTLRMNLAASIRILFFARIMDLGSISALLFLSSFAVEGDYRELARWLSFFFVIASIIITTPATERYVLGKLRLIFISGSSLASHIRRQIDNITTAVEQQGNWSPLTALLQSAGIWISAAFCLYCLLLSFGIEFSILQSFYCFGIYALFQLIPLQGFAGIGTQAAWWMLALTAAGYGKGDAAAMGIVLHGTFYFFIAVMAILALAGWRLLGTSGLER